MIYKVSVLHPTKSGPELSDVTNIAADRFTPNDDGSISFWNDESRFLSADRSTLVAYLPFLPEGEHSSWVIEDDTSVGDEVN